MTKAPFLVPTSTRTPLTAGPLCSPLPCLLTDGRDSTRLTPFDVTAPLNSSVAGRGGSGGHRRGLGAGAHAQLGQHPAHVVLDRLGRQVQPRRDLAVAV